MNFKNCYPIFSKWTYNTHSLLLETGQERLVHLSRAVMVGIIAAEFTILDPLKGTRLILLLGCLFIYLCYLGFLSFSWKRRLFLHTTGGRSIQILVDLIFISWIYLVQAQHSFDSYLLYLLPLVIAARYLPWKLLLTFAALSIILMAAISLSPFHNTSPLQSPVRYILIVGIVGLRFLYGSYLWRLVQQRYRLRNGIPVSGLTVHLADDATNESVPASENLLNTHSSLAEPSVAETCNVVNTLYQWALNTQGKPLDDMMEELVRIVQIYLRCETSAIFLIEDSVAKRKKVCGIPPTALAYETYRPGEWLTGRVFDHPTSGDPDSWNGKIVLNNNLSNHPSINSQYVSEYRRLLPSHQLRHLLALPIYRSGQVIGIVRVMNKLKVAGSEECDPLGFGYDDVTTLSTITTLIGNTFEQQANQLRLTKLNLIGEGLIKLSPSEEITDFVAKQVGDLLVADECAIYLLDEKTRLLQMVTSNLLDLTQTKTSYHYPVTTPVGSGFISYVAEEKEVVFNNDGTYRDHKGYSQTEEHLLNYYPQKCSALIVLPLLDLNRNCMGVMSILKFYPDSAKPNRFKLEDLQTAQIVASQLATALRREYHYNLRIEQKAKRIKNQAQLLKLEEQVILHLNDAPLALQMIADTSEDISGADVVCIYPFHSDFPVLYTERREWLRVSKGQRSFESPKAPRVDGTSQRIMESSNGYDIIDLDEEPQYMNEFLKQERIRCILGIRMEIDHHKFGVVFFDYRDRNKASITADEVNLAQLVTHLTALTLLHAEAQSLKHLTYKRTEKALEEQKELLDDLLDYLTLFSHSLRAPVYYSIRLIEILLDQPQASEPKPAEEHYMLQMVSDQLQLQLNRVDRMLSLRNSDWNGPDFKLTDVIEILNDVIYEQLEFARSKNIRLICTSSGDLPEVKADHDFIQDIFNILIANAIDFTPEGGEVEISYCYAQLENKLYLNVSDNGPGIEMDELNLIFHRYGQAGNQRQRSHNGKGLGLFFAKRFAIIHDGDILVESKEGEGSKFSLILPVQPAEPLCLATASHYSLFS